jgi:L-asparaginase II
MVKPIQAIPFLETGAADRFGLGSDALALACASHAGDAEHVRIVGDWLARLGRSGDDLICGAQTPLADRAMRALVRDGEKPSRLHNNCSGKHAAMLTTALHMGEPGSYGEQAHPVQQRVMAALSDLTDIDVERQPSAIDGCGVPTWMLPLSGLARAFARLARPEVLAPGRAATVRRINDAMVAHPALISGRHRFDTRILALCAGEVVVKRGAEGVHAAALRSRGLGIALKIDDGQARAADALMAALIERFCDLPRRARPGIRALAGPDLVNSQGVRVGRIVVDGVDLPE